MSSPGSSASSFSSIRSCQRHTDMLGAGFCTGCGTSLCAACARSKRHRQCTGCNEASGAKRSTIDATWFVHLFIDSLLLAWRQARARVFAIVFLTGLLATVALVSVFGDSESSGESASLTVFVLPAFMLLVGILVAPALEVPLASPVALPRRLLRAGRGALLPLALVSVLIGVPAWMSVPLFESDSFGLVLVGILFAFGLVAFSGLVVLPFVYPMQAFVALRGASLWQALRATFGAGLGALAVMGATHSMLAISSVSAIDTVSQVVMVATMLDPWAGLLVGWPLCIAAGAMMLFGMGAYGAASLRYVEDRKRLR